MENSLANKNPRDLKLSIESRSANNKSIVKSMALSFGRIKAFENGFELCDPLKKKSIFFLDIVELACSGSTLACRICNSEKPEQILAMNDRGKPKIRFGYNANGHPVYICKEDGTELQANTTNRVYIYCLDTSGPIPRNYWWGRENDSLYGYLDESKRTSFDLFILEKD